MTKKHWILAAAACAVCLGLGFAAGMLLAPRPNLGQAPLLMSPMATAEPDAPALSAGLPALGAPNPQATAEGENGALLGASGIGGIGGGTGTFPTEVSSQLDKLAALSDDFSGLTEQAQAEAAIYGDWQMLSHNMIAARPSGKGKGSPVPSSLSDACAALGVKLACSSDGSLDMTGWTKAMDAIQSGMQDSNSRLRQYAEELKVKFKEYEKAIYDLQTAMQKTPGPRVQYTDNTKLMQAVIEWVEGILE